MTKQNGNWRAITSNLNKFLNMKTHFTLLIISLFFAFSELNAQQSNQTPCYSELTNSKIKITPVVAVQSIGRAVRNK